MEELFEKYLQKLDYTSTDFIRSIMNTINWSARLIGIKGARGVGKTTLLLQYIKISLNAEPESSILYASLDNIWFSKHTLYDLVDTFVKRGGKYLFLDEVHKYRNWSQELKNIYDDFSELKVVFTGSSLLEILNAGADLSRRAIIYHMQGLSYREYLSIESKIYFDPLSLTDILENHISLTTEISIKVKPLQYFSAYLKHGYYPFYKELPELYFMRLEEVINMMLEIELPLLRGVDIAYVTKIKQLLLVISESVPFVPNVSKLSDKMVINRGTLLLYLHYLEEIGLTNNLFKNAGGISKLQKPSKIFLENTNLIYALAPEHANTGNVRETFFANQVRYHNKITFIEQTDFLVNEKYVFEIGGKDKNTSQIKDLKNAFIAADDIEYGFKNKIPLWLFGFMY
ncbi:MAG TPA: AAA family ATPase [Hanamia sp.]|nr:AAA family ATPase [Hanamia sp.]